ncbi:M23 family metallopeptidase [Brevundimonas sp.]|uniref:M23 family metallopeptidase n=1 Tax=Brevundimonas sp. TaxID=1871086 RepID=UPI0025CC4434|nr:M23 family metallopeptidase [Brevundimonas sp.]
MNRRAVVAAVLAAGLAPAVWAQSRPERLNLTGRFIQGGYAIGRTRPGALIFLDGEALSAAGASGLFVVGFDRDAPDTTLLEARLDGWRAEERLHISAGDFPTQRISGLPPSTVDPTDPALLERIQREAQLKAAAYASRDPSEGFGDGFDWPLAQFRITSRWGSQRILNGTPARPHYGIDLAAPAGTAILAPAPGLVVLAEPDLHYEGGTTFIDHGQGLITVYLHQSRLEVARGDRVTRGQRIGRVGATGRATGPHLCWRARWRDRNLDPSNLVGAVSV